MKKEVVQIVIALFTLALGGALEELAPKLLGVGVPVLLSAALAFAASRKPLPGLLFAVAAGAAEDALSGLPFALSLSFFTVLAGLLRGFKLPLLALSPAFFLYQIWLWIWLGASLNGNIFTRLAMALPLGCATLVVVTALLRWIDRKAAVHEK